jgi:hypothetical protein
VRDAERARITNAAYLALLGIDRAECSAGEAWYRLADRLCGSAQHCDSWSDMLAFVLAHGPLARRLLRAAGDQPSRPTLEATYRALCDCLQEGKLFDP